ncbi:retrotransposon protein, putative, Ty3-gypsy sub-class [Cucumis melo var. makuwa]|uniref:Retrotransposon protein, putative, Ty3-gypsy sub-class n=1 Tax=Cucumis melo var. makuwa TaxID=1194695 RepID=A0A5A7VK13_CUCMM|nr:retrotransposon protein, putative, Ty3-gypsy sub-class [Cucumis melo var. makuwa]
MGAPKASTTRPSIAFPAETSTIDPVRLTRSPSLIAFSFLNGQNTSKSSFLMTNTIKKGFFMACFEELKKRLVTAPILTLPVTGKEYVIYCDASRQGLGCVLMQKGKVIAYTSRQ